MASTTTTGKEEEIVLVLQHHPSHEHPLQLIYSTNDSSVTPICHLCHREISTKAQAYTCQERCENYYYHRLCVEAPSQIDLHPLHPAHPLHLVRDRENFRCDACAESFLPSGSSFWCHECDFDLDIACAMSTLSDEGRYQCGKTSEQIELPLHPHPLTSFTKRHEFVVDGDCYICKGSVEEDGYMCLRRPCEFVIHKECIRDLYYADGTKPPRVYHDHPLETFVEEDTSSITCASCGSNKSGEFIGCVICQVFYHRTCFQVPEILHYPIHHRYHTFIILFLEPFTPRQCRFCSISMEGEIYYRCTSCESFFMHVGCAFKVLAYCEEGTSAKIELSWHEHPLLLYHIPKYGTDGCNYCGDESIGPMYLCESTYCGFQLHKRCAETESTIAHPHHPDHFLTLCKQAIRFDNYWCKACGYKVTDDYRFSCERCLVDLHIKCVGSFPTHKHYLHEHKLVYVEYSNMDCHRCGTCKNSPLFRCVPCNFNLHEECMELPKVIRNDKIHWHPLTLHEIFLEDDTGEYYCEHCEKTRDPRLGVYVCGQCMISVPRIYHIHCVIPELGKIYEKKRLSFDFQKLKERIADKEEEARTIEENLKEETQKLREVRGELDELKNQHDKILKDDDSLIFN